MNILEIKKYPHPILRQRCLEIDNITPEIKKLVEAMKKTMEANNGIGLAANQVGGLKRIIVVRTKEGFQAFINPKILSRSKEKEATEEGCLSFPGLFLKIKRAKRAEFEALNEDGKEIKVRAEGLLARVVQHEIDHLDGILFIDRISFWQKLKIKKKLKFLTS